jgi:uncharacterized protein YdhG (YjbR/CyaY superfamily)
MRMTGGVPATVETYIAACPVEVQKIVRKLRGVVRKAAPDAEERLSYGMPAYFQGRVLVYFAAWKNHIGFYPTGGGIAAFKNELSGYVHAKGSVQFPLDEPIPYDLVTKIVRFRVAEVRQRDAKKSKDKKVQKKNSAKGMVAKKKG